MSSQLSYRLHGREQRPKTLRKHYRDELDTGQVKASAKVAESLFRKAVGDGLRQFSARAPTPSSWALRRRTVSSSHDKNRPKRFCRSMPVGTPVDVSSWRMYETALAVGSF
jgi:hypothetical protein